VSDFHLIASRLPGAQGAVNAAAITATVPDPPRNFTALDNGTILRGTVQGRDKDGLIAVSTDQGIVKLATNANLPAGSNVTLEVRSVGDRLQVVVLAVDQGTAPASTPATLMAAAEQSGTQGAAKPGATETGPTAGSATAADHAAKQAGTTAPVPANQPTVVVAGTRLTAIVIQSVPRDLIQSAAAQQPEPDTLAKAAPTGAQAAIAAPVPPARGTAADFRPPAPPPVQASLIPSIHDRIAALFTDATDASDKVPEAALLDADKAAARAISAVAPQVGALTVNPEMRQRIIELFVGASTEAPDTPPPDTAFSSGGPARNPPPPSAGQVFAAPGSATTPATNATSGAAGSVGPGSGGASAPAPASGPATAGTPSPQPTTLEFPPTSSTITIPAAALPQAAAQVTSSSAPSPPAPNLPASDPTADPVALNPGAQGRPVATAQPSPPPLPQSPSTAASVIQTPAPPAVETGQPPLSPQVTPPPAVQTPTPQTPIPQTTAPQTTAPATAEQQAGQRLPTGLPPVSPPGSPPLAPQSVPPADPTHSPQLSPGDSAASPQASAAPAPSPTPAASGSAAIPTSVPLPAAPQPGNQPPVVAVPAAPQSANPETPQPSPNALLTIPPLPDGPALSGTPLPTGINPGPGSSGTTLPFPLSSLPPALAATPATASDTPSPNGPSIIPPASPPATAGLVPQDPTVPTIPISPPVTAIPVTATSPANAATTSDGKTATTAQPQGNAAVGPGAAPSPETESTARTAPIPLTAIVSDASKLPLAGTPQVSGPTPANGAASAGGAPLAAGATPVSGAAPAGNTALPSGATLADVQAEYQTLNTVGSNIGLSETSGAGLPAGPLPTGTELRLRVLNIQQQGVPGNPLAAAQAAAASTGGKAAIIGQILGHTPAGHPVIHSPVGDLVLQQQASLPVGASITLAIEAVEMANAGGLNLPATPQMTALNLAQGWPTLLDLLLTLQHGPGGAGQPGSDADPAGIARLAQPGSKLAADLNAAMDAFKSGDFDKLFGPLASALKAGAGKQDGIRKLRDEFTQLSMLAQDRPQQDWRSFFLPIWDDGRLQQINLFYRRQRRNQAEKDGKEDATRFVVEVNFTRLGSCQLDGLIRKKHFDLMVRSHQELPLNVKRDLSGLFAEARELGNYAGDISFQTTARFPVVPLDDVVRDAPSVTA
jgi:hypothetical protein